MILKECPEEAAASALRTSNGTTTPGPKDLISVDGVSSPEPVAAPACVPVRWGQPGERRRARIVGARGMAGPGLQLSARHALQGRAVRPDSGIRERAGRCKALSPVTPFVLPKPRKGRSRERAGRCKASCFANTGAHNGQPRARRRDPYFRYETQIPWSRNSKAA